MVDDHTQNERILFKRMDFKRREFNRSFDDGLAVESPRDSFHSSKSSGSRNRSSGIFSLFKWFKKEKSEDNSDIELSRSEQTSPVFARAPSISGSVDTLFSTATANSFAYVHPIHYRPFGLADPPEIRIATGPETNTYRNRIRERDRLRYLEKNISLREKYRLYASGTLPNSVDHIHELNDREYKDLKKYLDWPPNSTLGRKKRKAPEPPAGHNSNSENNLPGVLDNEENAIRQHRRTLSEPVKYAKLCHVKGKRKAPQPPNTSEPDVISISTSNSNSSKRSKKKKRAPSPPVNRTRDRGIVGIIRDATDNILIQELTRNVDEESREETTSNASTLDIETADVVCTDTLKLERGILKQNMDKPFTESRVCPSSPVSPRPWYKRATSRDGSVRDKERRKERDRRKVEDWMLESGFPRRSFTGNDQRYNMFAKVDKADDKRKSQISILTNISELDREAAEIIRREKEREKTMIESHNAMYYNDSEPMVEDESSPKQENGRKTSARELITLFNAITNVTKVTVNTSFFNRDVSNMFNKGKQEKVIEENLFRKRFEISNKGRDGQFPVEVSHGKSSGGAIVIEPDDNQPGTSSASNGKIARVTIEELDEYDAERNSKCQVLYESNRQNRHLSPPIPTITEVSEGSAKSSPASTIASNNSDLPTDESTPAAQNVQTKQMNVWICPRCTLENLRWRITCEACDMWRPNPFELREKSVMLSEIKNKNKEIPKMPPLYPNLPSLNCSDSLLQSYKQPENKVAKTCITEKEADSKPNQEKYKVAKENNDKEVTKVSDPTPLNNFKTQPDKSKDTFNSNNKTVTTNTNSNYIAITSNNKLADSDKKISAPIIVGTNSLENVNGNKTNVIDKKTIETEIINDEIRKARIAFFDKSKVEKEKVVDEKEKSSSSMEKGNEVLYNNIETLNKSSEERNNQSKGEVQNQVITIQNKSAQVQTISKPQIQVNKIFSDNDDKNKLKEMLIEMKHSLPKRPKPFKKNENSVSDNQQAVEKRAVSSAIGPTQKTLGTKPFKANNNSNISIGIKDDTAEAFLVESETIIEEIKIKKPSEKVSSSVQTSGLVTQLVPKIKPPVGKEIVIPIKVEEHVIKDGILYTSISNETRKIGSGTFELLRPRDFANIKEIKTELKPGASPLYANIDTDISSTSNTPDDVSMNSSKNIDKLTKQLTKPQGVADFKAQLGAKDGKNVNTIAVNRLLKRLEGAIANGDHELAALLARELAQLKVNCSVIRQKSESSDKEVQLELYVEDRVSHQGPFPLKVNPSFTVKQLKEKIGREYEIPIGVQRWILGKQLAADDSATLESLEVNTDGCPVFLYLVIPELLKGEDIEIEEVTITPKQTSADSISAIREVERRLDNHKSNNKDGAVAGPSRIKQELDLNVYQDENKEQNKKENSYQTGTLALGWKCEVCTLMNSPTRPGCAACTTDRPHGYNVPENYKMSDAEAERIHKETNQTQQATKAVEEEKAKNYQQLVDLEKDDLIIYPEKFECPICLVEYEPTEGIVLRECLHVFCRVCLANTIHFSEEAEVMCPFRDNNYTCDSTLLEREIKALVTPEVYEEHLAKSIALAETKIGNAFHCKTPDCKGWCIYEDNVNIFVCPVCTHINCLTCQAIHEGLNCKQFQEQLSNNSDMNIESKRTKEMLQEMVDRGEAMNCPTCQVVLMKKWGCDWLRCSMCKTEICWVTRGPRWGPNGKGDTNGGCQCGVNGIKCHPKCTYCH